MKCAYCHFAIDPRRPPLVERGHLRGLLRGHREGGGRAARGGERILGGREHRAEALFTGLRRREGVDRGDFRRRYGVDPLEEHGQALADAFAAGLLLADDDRLWLTERGVLLSNEVFRALV